jgi:hypothetical protein
MCDAGDFHHGFLLETLTLGGANHPAFVIMGPSGRERSTNTSLRAQHELALVPEPARSIDNTNHGEKPSHALILAKSTRAEYWSLGDGAKDEDRRMRAAAHKKPPGPHANQLIHSDLTQNNWRMALCDGDGRFENYFNSSKYDCRILWDRHDPEVLSPTHASLYRYNVQSGQTAL